MRRLVMCWWFRSWLLVGVLFIPMLWLAGLWRGFTWREWTDSWSLSWFKAGRMRD
jgi:hypothetical protein